MIPDKTIELGLREIRRTKRISMWLLLGFLPFSFAIIHLIKITFLVVILCIGYMVTCFIYGVCVNFATCPRCNGAFHSRPLKSKRGGVFMNCFSNSCLNCGLSISDLDSVVVGPELEESNKP